MVKTWWSIEYRFGSGNRVEQVSDLVELPTDREFCKIVEMPELPRVGTTVFTDTGEEGCLVVHKIDYWEKFAIYYITLVEEETTDWERFGWKRGSASEVLVE